MRQGQSFLLKRCYCGENTGTFNKFFSRMAQLPPTPFPIILGFKPFSLLQMSVVCVNQLINVFTNFTVADCLAGYSTGLYPLTLSLPGLASTPPPLKWFIALYSIYLQSNPN